MNSKRDCSKGGKKPDGTWVLGTIQTVPTKKDKPYIVLLGNKLACLSRKVAKGSVGYENLRPGVKILCDVNYRGERRYPLVRHCALATP